MATPTSPIVSEMRAPYDYTREQVTTHSILPQQRKAGLWVLQAEQVNLALEQTPQLVRVAANEQPQRLHHSLIFYVNRGVGDFVQGLLERMHKGTQVKAPIGVDESNTVRRRKR